jgi:hypothetical protein
MSVRASPGQINDLLLLEQERFPRGDRYTT